MRRISASDYAKRIGKHPDTIQRWCQNKLIPNFKVGRSYEIDPEAADRHLRLKYGNEPERELAKKHL